jgi:hypothetical protein
MDAKIAKAREDLLMIGIPLSGDDEDDHDDDDDTEEVCGVLVLPSAPNARYLVNCVRVCVRG